MTLDDLNLLPRTEAAIRFSHCCGSSQWAKTMALKRPYFDQDELLKAADSVWRRLTTDDWKEAFSHHPKIGDVEALRERFASTPTWAEGEQANVRNTPEAILDSLARANIEYEKRFGYIFIVCATGKTADEMLSLLEHRLQNDPADEINVAAEEQRKITQLRLHKLLDRKES
jgi:2-oxo-4-hydroxy-4-carboxy-5-ureidoimidazoline decarboxylase